jgi:hypothetical protein
LSVDYYAVENPRVTRIYRNTIAERILQVSKQLAAGGAPDYAAYQRAVGRIEGLNEALAILSEIESKER